MTHQLALPMKPDMQPIDEKVIAAQSSLTKAIALCQQLSGIDDKELCGPNGIVKDVAQWSRIKSGQHYFPQDKLGYLMDICGNEAPLLWLARDRGYRLEALETETQRQLRLSEEKRAKVEEENRLLRELIQGKR